MYARAGAPLLLAVSQPLLCILNTAAAAAAQRPTAEVYSENSACVIARRDRSLLGGRRLPPQPADRGPTPVPPTEYREYFSKRRAPARVIPRLRAVGNFSFLHFNQLTVY